MMNKKISTIAGSLIILAIVIALGFVFFLDKEKGTQNQNSVNPITENKNNKDESNEEQFKELNEQELAEIKELTKDWKTFRDEEYGYEFKYPQDYYVVKPEEDKDYKATKIVSEKKYPGDGGCPNPPCNLPTHPQEINLRVFEDPKNLSIAEVKKRLEGNIWDKSSGRHLFVDSKQAFYYEGGSHQAETIYIFGDKKTFYISTGIEWSAPDFKNIFQGIYSTFREIHKETKTTFEEELKNYPPMDQKEVESLTSLTQNWKTFRDEEYGYEFKYPQDYYIEKNKYNKDIDEASIISSGKCTQNFNEKCNITIRTLSPEDERVKNLKENYSQETTIFFIDGNKITYRISDGLNAMIQAKQKIYFITSLSYPKEVESIFQGIYSTFKEIR